MDLAAGRMVRWARRRAGMTQTALAARAGIPQPAIARIERGVVVPRAATLLALLEATGHELAVEPRIGSGADVEAIRRRLRMAGPERTRVALKATRQTATAPFDPTRILRRLRRFGVRFVVIGSVAEVAHGSPRMVEPVVEICHARDPENVERLTTMALEDLAATPPIGAEELTSSDAAQFETVAGRLSLSARPLRSDGFDELSANATKAMVDVGLEVAVASIDDLIRIRRHRDRPEDAEALALLGALRGVLDARGER